MTLHPLALGSVESLRVGDPLFLVGDPFGYARSLSTGVGFAVPIDLARSGLPQLERGVTPAHAFLGVGADATGSGGRNGALVQSVRAGSPAAAGLKVDDVTLTQQPATAASG